MTMGRAISVFAAFLVVMTFMTIFFGSWYTVDQGERAVILRNGALYRVDGPGLAFKLPIIDDAEYLSVRTQKVVYPEVSSYSKDIQWADIAVSVNVRLDPGLVAQVYETYRTLDEAVSRVLTPRVNSFTKVVFGRFNAATAIAERGRLVIEVNEALISATAGTGLIVEAVQIEDIQFSEEFENSIEQRMMAEIDVAKKRQNWEKEKVEADIIRTIAQGAADAVVFKATAEADAIKLVGNAEAEAIKARGIALGENPALVALVQAERWNGELPTTMVPSGTLPILQMSRQ
jgi:regulator of protease activity HflC (stomatin/prohibitin superfamily)